MEPPWDQGVYSQNRTEQNSFQNSKHELPMEPPWDQDVYSQNRTEQNSSQNSKHELPMEPPWDQGVYTQNITEQNSFQNSKHELPMEPPWDQGIYTQNRTEHFQISETPIRSLHIWTSHSYFASSRLIVIESDMQSPLVCLGVSVIAPSWSSQSDACTSGVIWLAPGGVWGCDMTAHT